MIVSFTWVGLLSTKAATECHMWIPKHTKNIKNLSYVLFLGVLIWAAFVGGHVIALMEPWRAPKYCRRAWCVFELHTALEARDLRQKCRDTRSTRREPVLPGWKVGHCHASCRGVSSVWAKRCKKYEKSPLASWICSLKVLGFAKAVYDGVGLQDTRVWLFTICQRFWSLRGSCLELLQEQWRTLSETKLQQATFSLS